MATQEEPNGPRPKRPKPPNNARMISDGEAQQYQPIQTFNRYAENRSKKNPRKWVITYQLIEGTAADPNRKRPQRPATPPQEPPAEEAPAPEQQPSFFEPAPAPSRRGNRLKQQ